jgi:uncharacterized coiled-coil protein SlyX
MLGDLLVGEKMEKCDGCDYIKRIVHLEERVAEQNKRLSVLESFVEWAEPVIRKIEDMQKNIAEVSTSQRWMSVIFAGFVTIVAFVYASQVVPSMEKQADGDVEIIREIHKGQLDTQKRIDELKLQIITSSKINHTATVKKVEEMVK